jgi:Tol biopolymer transport system component
MTPGPDLDRRLSAWYDDRAQPHAPDGLLAATLARTSGTRRRPAWRIPERWIPMTVSLRLAVMPRALIYLLLFCLLVALTVGVFAVGGRLGLLPAVSLPPPVGPAANGLIAYDSAGDIWVVNPDGTDPRQLTTSPALEHGPSWSADGTRLVFWSQDAPGAPSSLVVIDADGSAPRTIATDDAGRTSFWAPEWSPDGHRVAYSLGDMAGTPQANERVYVAATDGTGISQVGDLTLLARRPVWSPDGTTLAFEGNREPVGASNPSGVECCYPEQGVYVMAADGSDVRRLTKVENEVQFAFFRSEWSPDGSQIVTTVGGQVWIIASDGSTESALTELPVQDALVSRWSPRGDRIAFVSLDINQLWAIPASGGERVDVGPSDGGFTWSPDGTSFAILGRNGRLAIRSASGDVLATIDALDLSYPANIHYPSWQRIAP